MRKNPTSPYAFIALLGVSCIDPNLPAIGEGQPFRPEADEKRLWVRAEEEQQRLRRSGLVYDDPAFNEYINGVAQRLLTPDIRKAEIPFRVEVIKNPYLNAFAYPNGAIYVHTGLLARMENEAQLATLLGHEMSHVINRHAIKNMRTVKQQSAVGATMVGVLPVVGLLGALGATAAISGYSKELEREADQNGFAMTISSGYDPVSGSQLFVFLKKDIDEQNIKEPFFFGTHPRIQERIDSYNELLKRTSHQNGEVASDRFAQMVVPVLIVNARLDLALGHWVSAQEAATKVLARQPNNAVANYLLAETYRQRGRQGDSQKAENYYRQAIERNVSLAEAYKGLGLLRLKDTNRGPSKEAFEKYLALKPEAEDRAYIEQYIRDLEAEPNDPVD